MAVLSDESYRHTPNRDFVLCAMPPIFVLTRVLAVGCCDRSVFRLIQALVDAGAEPARYGTFRLDFHRFDRFELDLRGHTHMRGAALSCLRLKWADMVLI